MNSQIYRSMKGSGLFPVLIIILLTTLSLSGCSLAKKRVFEKTIARNLNLNGFGDHFTGLMVYDPVSGDTLFRINQDIYFTPASNTKIFTLYTAMKILGDSLPIIRYSIQGDTLFFTGTGNPANLHSHFRDSSMVKFLQARKHLVYVPGTLDEGRFGPGWAWEDYDSSFAPERSVLPLYGNVVRIYPGENPHVEPLYFKDSVLPLGRHMKRLEHSNTFFVDPSGQDTLEIPFITSDLLTGKLLEGILGRSVHLGEDFPEREAKLLYGKTPADTLYRHLMQESDNFIAEQLLILSSAVLTDTLSMAFARDFVLDTYLADMKNKPRWVDGSGLSRYNLFTPASMVFVLEKLLAETGRERLFEIFPSGGKNGTLENWYAGANEPYVFAKSGTLGNTYCLSGYLIGKSGKLLVFSFMNNHYVQPTAQLKGGLQSVLEEIRDAY